MNGKDIELTRRRVLGGVATIGAASAAAGAGTFALFSDTESSSGNLSAGTLDLQSGGTSTISFTTSDIKPTQSGSGSVDLQKSGSVTGDLSVSVPNVASTEGGTNPESETNTDTGDNGELDDEVKLALWIGTGGATDTTFGSGDIALLNDGTTGSSKTFASAASYAGVNWSNVITSFSGPVAFNVEWKFPDQTSNNDAQGDDLTVDFEFSLVQQ